MTRESDLNGKSVLVYELMMLDQSLAVMEDYKLLFATATVSSIRKTCVNVNGF